MAEFSFKLNSIFRTNIIKVGRELVPTECPISSKQNGLVAAQIAEIVNVMGELSATAQGLRKPITTAKRMRESVDPIFIYLVADVNRGRQGAVCGLLKVGHKNLFLYDSKDMLHNIRTPSILDFYVHENCRRVGYGFQLFEYMRKDLGWHILQCAIDKPTNMMISFLNKHYNLNKKLPQKNNFVIFDGFFEAIKQHPSEIDAKDSANGKKNKNDAQRNAPPTSAAVNTVTKMQTYKRM